jgi:hypothetical protein
MYLSEVMHYFISVTTFSRIVYPITDARSADRPGATASDKRYLSDKIMTLTTALQKKRLRIEASMMY